jgi:Domain of unknown function (DUF1905)
MAERTSARKAPGTPVIRFEAQVERTGGSTILRLPGDASAKLPSRGQVAVKGAANGHAFQTVLEPDGIVAGDSDPDPVAGRDDGGDGQQLHGQVHGVSGNHTKGVRPGEGPRYP